MNQKFVDTIGWFASIMAIMMFFSYIDQIRLNISGQPGSVILPIVTTMNCILWASYGYLKPKRDWPIILPNLLGMLLGIITAITAVM